VGEAHHADGGTTANATAITASSHDADARPGSPDAPAAMANTASIVVRRSTRTQ